MFLSCIRDFTAETRWQRFVTIAALEKGKSTTDDLYHNTLTTFTTTHICQHSTQHTYRGRGRLAELAAPAWRRTAEWSNYGAARLRAETQTYDITAVGGSVVTRLSLPLSLVGGSSKAYLHIDSSSTSKIKRLDYSLWIRLKIYFRHSK